MQCRICASRKSKYDIWCRTLSMPCNFRWVVLRTVLYGNIHTKFVAKVKLSIVLHRSRIYSLTVALKAIRFSHIYIHLHEAKRITTPIYHAHIIRAHHIVPHICIYSCILSHILHLVRAMAMAMAMAMAIKQNSHRRSFRTFKIFCIYNFKQWH